MQRVTRDGRPVVIETTDKPGMSIFKVFGSIDGKPCHWTAEGRWRMDGLDDPRDLVEERGGSFPPLFDYLISRERDVPTFQVITPTKAAKDITDKKD